MLCAHESFYNCPTTLLTDVYAYVECGGRSLTTVVKVMDNRYEDARNICDRVDAIGIKKR